jgi:thiamine-phosphate diphosphorylase
VRLPPRLVALTPGDLLQAAVPRLLAALERATAGGLCGLLLREPAWSDRALLELARGLRAMLPPPGWLAVHDRPHVALAAGADAVHLGFRSLPPSAVRELVGRRLALGRSTHAGDAETWWRGADYLFHGPVNATPSKAGWQEPIGLPGLQRACAGSALPVLAIGGLRPQDARGALAAGAHGLAVRAGILAAVDPGAACALYLREIEAVS